MSKVQIYAFFPDEFPAPFLFGQSRWKPLLWYTKNLPKAYLQHMTSFHVLRWGSGTLEKNVGADLCLSTLTILSQNWDVVSVLTTSKRSMWLWNRNVVCNTGSCMLVSTGICGLWIVLGKKISIFNPLSIAINEICPKKCMNSLTEYKFR